MSDVTRLTPPPVSAYAPGAASTHVSEVTVAAVDKIGKDTADHIEHLAVAIETDAGKLAAGILNEAKDTAERILSEAKAAADELRTVATGYQKHTRTVAQDVSNFCLRMASARAMARGLEGDIKDGIKPVTSETDDGEPSPQFLHDRSRES